MSSETVTNSGSAESVTVTVVGALSWIVNAPKMVIAWATGFLEFIAEHLHMSAASVFIKASPIMAPAPSGIAIYGALVGMYGSTNALVMMFVFEALGFAGIYIRNKYEEYNRANPGSKKPMDKAELGVKAYLVVTIVTILMFKVIPAWAEWFTGDVTIVEALKATATLIFPGFSYIGANIYSMMDVLTGEKEKEEKAASDAVEALKNRIAELAAEIVVTKEALGSAKSEAKLAQNKALEISSESQREIQNLTNIGNELRMAKAILETKVKGLESQIARESQIATLATEHAFGQKSQPKSGQEEAQNLGKKVKPAERRRMVLEAMMEADSEPTFNAAEVARQIGGVTDETIRNDKKWLIGNGYFNAETWSKTEKELP